MHRAAKGKTLSPQAIPVLDEQFMTSADGRWARILAETTYAEFIMKKQGIKHTVVFFGSARICPKEEGEKDKHPEEEKLRRYYNDCRLLSKKVTEWSLSHGSKDHPQPFVITTGGGPAIMEAGNRGADDADGKTIGLNITLPMEQYPNPYITGDLNFDFNYFFTRKFHFSYRAKVLVAFPGGFGTFDELFEILTLIQTQKITKPCCILLYGKEFWERVVDFQYLVDCGVISASDLDLFTIIDEVDPALELITSHLKQFI
ncbi:MAG: TIGR00730 family Rossman fold protein [Planctomycetes bacterium]|nr:TIGR00730 family Rossman fold protein [Planctomycetota bacterium]